MVALEKHIEVALPEAVEDILSRVRFGTPEDQASAALTLALLLELNARGLNLENYRLVLPEELLTLHLTCNEERELMLAIRDVFLFENSHPTLLWACGKARPSAGLGPLLEILEERRETLTEEASYQLLSALGDLLLLAEERDLGPLGTRDPRPWIARLAARHPGRVRENGRRLLWDLGSSWETYN
jgi:hypothetical protein